MSPICYSTGSNNRQEKYNIKPFIDQYDKNGIDFPSHKKDWNMIGIYWNI